MRWTMPAAGAVDLRRRPLGLRHAPDQPCVIIATALILIVMVLPAVRAGRKDITG